MRNVVMTRMRNGRIVAIPVTGETDFQTIAAMMIQGGAIVLNTRITQEEYYMLRHEMFVMP